MNTLTLTANVPDGTGLHRLTFDRTLEGFTRPGQFLTAHVEEHKPAFFAIASVPGAPIELLVKRQGDAAEALCAMGPGSVVEVSDPMGNGFPLDASGTEPLVILAAGSGLSGVRALIEAEIDRGLPRPVTLLYGVFTPAHRAYVERLDAWAAAGVDVQPVYSEPEPDWDGATGFVQHAAHELGLVRPDVTVVLCGFPQMVDDARKLWSAVGTPEERLLTNY